MNMHPILIAVLFATPLVARSELVEVKVGDVMISIPVPEGFVTELPINQDEELQESMGNRVLMLRQSLGSAPTDFMVTTPKSIEEQEGGVDTAYFARMLVGFRKAYIQGLDQKKYSDVLGTFNSQIAKLHKSKSSQVSLLPLGIRYEDDRTGVYQALRASTSEQQKLLETNVITTICCLIKGQILCASFTASKVDEAELRRQGDDAQRWVQLLQLANGN